MNIKSGNEEPMRQAAVHQGESEGTGSSATQDEQNFGNQDKTAEKHTESTTMMDNSNREMQSSPKRLESTKKTPGQRKLFKQGSVYDRYLNKKPALPKNIECMHCNAKFEKPEYYERHLLMHNIAFEKRKKRAAQAEYICSVCSMVFLRKASLQMHAKIHKTQCKVCKKTLKSERALDAHFKAEHLDIKADAEQASELQFDFEVEVKMENEENVASVP